MRTHEKSSILPDPLACCMSLHEGYNLGYPLMGTIPAPSDCCKTGNCKFWTKYWERTYGRYSVLRIMTMGHLICVQNRLNILHGGTIASMGEPILEPVALTILGSYLHPEILKSTSEALWRLLLVDSLQRACQPIWMVSAAWKSTPVSKVECLFSSDLSQFRR